MSSHQYNVAVIAGDYIGPEVMEESIKVLKKISTLSGYKFNFTYGLVGGAAYEKVGSHLPAATLDLCKQSDAVLFGSVGGPVDAQEDPKWKDAERNSILPLRSQLKLAVNVRPIKVDKSLTHLSPLKNVSKGVDIVIIRELVSGIYFGKHETVNEAGKSRAIDVMTYSEDEIAIPVTEAFKLALKRRNKLTVIDKANVLDCSKLWRKVAKDIHESFPEVELDFMYVDNACMQIIKDPNQFDVIVTGNMFGDILSDAASMIPGSVGLLPSASLGENGVHMYEPIGGSAPTIAGMNKANPIAQILSGAMFLRYTCKLEKEAKAIEDAVATTLSEGMATCDIVSDGQQACTMSDMTNCILKHLEKIYKK